MELKHKNQQRKITGAILNDDSNNNNNNNVNDDDDDNVKDDDGDPFYDFWGSLKLKNQESGWADVVVVVVAVTVVVVVTSNIESAIKPFIEWKGVEFLQWTAPTIHL